VNAVLLSPLKLHDPSRLVAVNERSLKGTGYVITSTSPGSFFDWQSNSKTLKLGGLYGSQGVVMNHGEPEQLSGVSTVGSVLGVTAVQPLFGRLLTVADEDPAAPATIVLSFTTWHRLFGDDRGV